MRLFHALDTKIFQKMYKNYVDIHGPEHVYAFRKSRLYLRLKVFPRFMVLVLYVIGIFYLFISLIDTSVTRGYIIGIILSIIVAIFLNVNLLKKYLDYKCDFIIVTPVDIVIFDQHGIFKRNIQSIAREKINSISTERAGFLPNIFNVGTLIIQMQGGNETSEITIRYIYKPDNKRQQMMAIIGKTAE